MGLSVPDAIAPRSRRRVGAFFDVDNTLIPGMAIEVQFFRFLFKRGLVGLSEGMQSVWHLLRHMPPMSLHPLRERKLYLTGKHPTAIEPLAEEFVRSQILPRISQDGLAVLRKHQQAEHHVVLITGSLDFLIAPLASTLNISTVLAATPVRLTTGYTGHLVPPLPYGEGKRILIESLTAQENMDLRECYAYGDSPGDVAVLQSVGHPHVVNPIRGMGRIAKRHGWPIFKWA